MIVKSISHNLRKSPTDLIKYVFDRRKTLLDPDGKPLYFKRNIRSYDKNKWCKQFNDLEWRRHSSYANKSVVCYHEIISFHPESTKYLNRSIIKDLVSRYIELRCNEQMVVGGTHFEATGKNWHVHLIFSGIKVADKRSARISRSRFEAIKRKLQQYQIDRYPFLKDSIVELGKKKD